jgi:hypothetical protein
MCTTEGTTLSTPVLSTDEIDSDSCESGDDDSEEGTDADGDSNADAHAPVPVSTGSVAVEAPRVQLPSSDVFMSEQQCASMHRDMLRNPGAFRDAAEYAEWRAARSSSIPSLREPYQPANGVG